MTTDRLDEIIKGTAYPDSNSVYQAVYQVENEMQQEFNSRICTNCSKWKQENGTQKVNNKGMCNSYRDADEYYAIGITSGTHGCNEFKRKDK